MWLANFEMEAGTSSPLVGATVQAIVSSLVHPNPGSVVATTSTNLNGYWEFTSLADGVTYDVKVASGGKTKWYKGLTRHNLTHMYDDRTPLPNRNILHNGGQGSWIERGTGTIALPVGDPGVYNTADGWTTFVGSGDSGVAQQETTTVASNSKSSARIAYTRAGGQATHQRVVPDILWQELRGQTVSASFQVFQQTASSELRAFIDDGVSVTFGTVVSTAGSWVTLGVIKAISATATKIVIGVQTNRADTGARTFYVDNGMADLTSVVPVYAISPDDIILSPTIARALVVQNTPATDANTVSTLLGNLAARIRDIIGGGDWKSVIPRTVTQIQTEKVAKAGDSMSGALSMAANVPVALGPNGDNIEYISGADVFAMFVHGTFLMQNVGGTQQWLNVNGTRVFIPTFLLLPNNSRISDSAGSVNIRAAGDTFVVENLASTFQMLNIDPTRLLINGNIAIHAGNIGAQSVTFATNAANLGSQPAANYPRRAAGRYHGNGSGAQQIIRTGFQVLHLTVQSVDNQLVFISLGTHGSTRMQSTNTVNFDATVLCDPSDGFRYSGGATNWSNLNAVDYDWVAFG